MLGTLCGIALVFIGTVPLATVFENPFIGFASMIIILWGLVGRFRLPFNIPAGLLALAVGTVVALAIGQSKISFEGVGFYPPVPYFGDLVAGIQHLFANPELFLVLVPVQIYNFIETMNNVESAEAAGDHYPVATCQITDGAGTMIGALFGSPFPTTAYIGHPAYKRMGAHSGYVIGVGVVIPLAAFLGPAGVPEQPDPRGGGRAGAGVRRAQPDHQHGPCGEDRAHGRRHHRDDAACLQLPGDQVGLADGGAWRHREPPACWRSATRN